MIVTGRLVAGLFVCSCLGAASWPFSLSRKNDLIGWKIGQKPAPFLVPVVDPVEAKVIQVYPPSREGWTFRRSHGQTKAVVLIHGFHVQPFRNGDANKAIFHSWQQPDSKLVETLGLLADVFAFAYSQNVSIEEIAGVPCLADNVRRLRMLGYTDIVLVGHSAGGLIARQFIEDYPDAGVTKVVQVCSPNGGTSYAQLEPGVHKNQRIFLHSLTKEARAMALKERAGKKIPTTLQFVCVVGAGARLGDGVVSTASQWPPDLQAQGIPVVSLRTTHFTVMRTSGDIQRLAELIRGMHSRWNPAQIARVKKDLGVK